MEKTRIIFIDLSISNKIRYICDIVEKLYDEGLFVTIYAGEKRTAENIDRQLWVWKQESFIPHSITDSLEHTKDESIIITTNPDIGSGGGALILYDPLPMDKFENYTLIIDFAEVYSSDLLQKSRQRFKEIRDSEKYRLEYKKLGAFLNSIHIKSQ